MSLVAVAGLAWATAAAGHAQLNEGFGWQGEVRHGFVRTDGNSETESLSLRSKVKYVGRRMMLDLEAGGLQTQTTSFLRFAQLPETPGDDPIVIKVPSSNLRAERYDARVGVSQRIESTLKTFWFARLEWDRDEPAGVRNRYVAVAGAGNTWISLPDMRFSTSYGLSYNREPLKVEGEQAVNYPGFRLEWDYWWNFLRDTSYSN